MNTNYDICSKWKTKLAACCRIKDFKSGPCSKTAPFCPPSLRAETDQIGNAFGEVFWYYDKTPIVGRNAYYEGIATSVLL